MKNVRRLFLCIIAFSLVFAIPAVGTKLALKLILNKFEIYDSLMASVGQSINHQLTNLQNQFYDIKAENSTAFECVGLHGDLFPINQLNTSFHKRLDEYQNRKEILTDILKFNSNVSFSFI